MQPQKQNGKRMVGRPFGTGRPRREPKPGERVKLGLRVTAEVKRKLDEMATYNGRSQSQEAEFRLERSFWLDDMLKARLISARVPAASPKGAQGRDG